MSEYVKSKGSTTVPLADGTHRALEPGESISVDELSEGMQESLKGEGSNAEWTSNLFEESSQEDFDSWQAGNRTLYQDEFDRDRLNRLPNIVLPGPDEVVVYNEDGTAELEPAPETATITAHTSSAVTVEGPAADAVKNQHVGSNEPSPPPVEGQVGLNAPEHEGDETPEGVEEGGEAETPSPAPAEKPAPPEPKSSES